MPEEHLRILLIEDNDGDSRLIREFLREKEMFSSHLDRVETLAAGLKKLRETEPDVVLLDLSLPDSQGEQTLHKVQEQASGVPVVVLTGHNDPEDAARLVREGAQDYLVKDEFDGRLLQRAIRYAIERKRYSDADRKKMEMLNALYVGARHLSESLNSREIAKNMTRDLVEKFGVSLAGVFQAEPDGEVRLLDSCPIHIDYPRMIELRWDKTPLGSGPAGVSIKNGLPVIVENIEEDSLTEPWHDKLLAFGFRTMAAFPLVHRGKAFATFLLYSDKEGFFSPERVDFFHSYANLSAASLTNARLFAEKERHIEKLIALRNIDMAITSSLDVRVTFNVILDNVTSQLDVDAADILLLNPHTQVLEHAANRGFRTRRIKDCNVKIGEGVAGRAVLERRTIQISNLQEADDTFTRREISMEEDFVTYFCVPLITKGHVQGVLEIFHREPFRPENGWMDFLEALAGQAAIAIDNAALFNDLNKANIEMAMAYESTIEGWARALDYRDRETEGHSRRVTDMTVRIASEMGLNDALLSHIRRGALLHDIGKLGVPDHVLFKPGKLEGEEWGIMKKHPELAYKLLAPISYLRPAISIPYCHHERWDGTGYPRGLKGEEIPLEARIFALVDVWDALSSNRPYRKAWPKEKILSYLREEAGRHFDPQVVEVFFRLQN